MIKNPLTRAWGSVRVNVLELLIRGRLEDLVTCIQSVILVSRFLVLIWIVDIKVERDVARVDVAQKMQQ